MAHGAKLTTTDAVPEMSAAIERFRGEAMAALEELDMEIRRAVEWIAHERLEHWSRETQRGWERISESRVQLNLAKTARRIGNDDPTCVDEKKALDRAKKGLEVAQEKLERTKHWARTIDKAVQEFIGYRTAISSWLECEAPKAVATLDRIADQLETYLAIQPDMTGELLRVAQTSKHNVAKQDAQNSATPADAAPQTASVDAATTDESSVDASTARAHTPASPTDDPASPTNRGAAS